MTIARCEAEEHRCRFNVFFAANEGVDFSPPRQRDGREHVPWEEVFGKHVPEMAGESLAFLSSRMDASHGRRKGLD